jgi:hypothetical protein
MLEIGRDAREANDIETLRSGSRLYLRTNDPKHSTFFRAMPNLFLAMGPPKAKQGFVELEASVL